MKKPQISQSITDRQSSSFNRYLQEIGKIKLLSAEEEVDLTRRIKQGDSIALELLTKANLRFVVSIAKQYQNEGLSLPDLTNEGNMGLIKAAQRFDETRGFKFISYAVWRIRQSILAALYENARIVRLPLNKFGDFNKIGNKIRELEQILEREPTDDELIQAGVDADSIVSYRTDYVRHTSLDKPIGEDGDATLLDMQVGSTADQLTHTIYDDEIKKVIIYFADTYLTEIQKDVLFLHYGIGVESKRSTGSIADKYNKSEQWVRIVRDKAMNILKKKQGSIKRVFEEKALPRPIVKKAVVPNKIESNPKIEGKNGTIKHTRKKAHHIPTESAYDMGLWSYPLIEEHLRDYIKNGGVLDHAYICTLDSPIPGYEVLGYLCNKYISYAALSSQEKDILDAFVSGKSIRSICATTAIDDTSIVISTIVSIYQKLSLAMQLKQSQ